MEKEKIKQQTTPRTYSISSKQLMDIMRYLMTRPYGEVVQLMTSLSTLAPQSNVEVRDGGKK